MLVDVCAMPLQFTLFGLSDALVIIIIILIIYNILCTCYVSTMYEGVIDHCLSSKHERHDCCEKASRLDYRAVRVQGHSFVPMTTWGFLVDLRSAMSSSITGTLDMEVHAYTEYYTTCGL